jgi:hypothetical protein
MKWFELQNAVAGIRNKFLGILYIRIDWPDQWNNYLAFCKGHEPFESNPIINSYGFRDLKRDNSSIDCKEIYSKRKILLEER